MTATPPSSYQFGPFHLDVRDHRLLRDGRTVPLTPKVFAVLRVLVENSGHLVEKDDLLKQVWPDSFVEEGALNRAVSVLRKALDDNAPGSEIHRDRPEAGISVCRPCHLERRRRRPLEQRRPPAAASPAHPPAGNRRHSHLRSCWWAASGSAFRGGRRRNQPGVVAARARPPAGDVHGTGRLADRLTGRQAHCLRVQRQAREETVRPGTCRRTAGRDFRRARAQLPALVARRPGVARLVARGQPEWHLRRASAWRHAASDRDGAGVPLVLVARRLDDRGGRRRGQQDPILRRARAGAAVADARGRSLVDLGSRLVGRRRQAALRQQRPSGPLRNRDHPARRQRPAEDPLVADRDSLDALGRRTANAIYYLQRVNQTMSLFRIPADASTARPPPAPRC